MILGVLVIAMLVLLLLRVPVAISMLLPCLAYVVWSPDISLGVALQQTVGSVDSFPLLAVPLFIMTRFFIAGTRTEPRPAASAMAAPLIQENIRLLKTFTNPRLPGTFLNRVSSMRNSRSARPPALLK